MVYTHPYVYRHRGKKDEGSVTHVQAGFALSEDREAERVEDFFGRIYCNRWRMSDSEDFRSAELYCRADAGDTRKDDIWELSSQKCESRAITPIRRSLERAFCIGTYRYGRENRGNKTIWHFKSFYNIFSQEIPEIARAERLDRGRWRESDSGRYRSECFFRRAARLYFETYDIGRQKNRGCGKSGI